MVKMTEEHTTPLASASIAYQADVFLLSRLASARLDEGPRGHSLMEVKREGGEGADTKAIIYSSTAVKIAI